MSLSFVGAVTGTDTATLPAHQAGDLFIALAYRDGATGQPTLPVGWTSVRGAGGNSNAFRMCRKLATSSAEPNDTFVNATGLVIAVYRPASGYELSVGASAHGAGVGVSITYPTITLQTGDGTSWVFASAGHRSINTALETAPPGMVNRGDFLDAVNEVATHDTNGGVSSWAQQIVAVGGSSSGWYAPVCEIKVAATVGGAYSLTAAPGAYAVTGASAALRLARQFVASPGSYALTGNAASLGFGRRLTADPGAYVLTGQSVGLSSARSIAAETGSYVLTGNAATLVYSTLVSNYSITADAGSYALTGNAAGLKLSRAVQAEAGSYILTGSTAALSYGRNISVQTGAYALLGEGVSLRMSRTVQVDSGIYELFGNETNLLYNPVAQRRPVFFVIG